MELKEVERGVLRYTNMERKKRGLRPLLGHPTLIEAARSHSRWMASHGFISHQGKRRSEPTDRASAAGYPTGAGENVLMMPARKGDKATAKAAVRIWMRSPGHKENILSGDYWDIGIGVARDKNGQLYMTQNFGLGRSLSLAGDGAIPRGQMYAPQTKAKPSSKRDRKRRSKLLRFLRRSLRRLYGKVAKRFYVK